MSGVAVAVDECGIHLSALKVLFYAGMPTIAMIIIAVTVLILTS
jgi:hypothetical protein